MKIVAYEQDTKFTYSPNYCINKELPDHFIYFFRPVNESAWYGIKL